MAAALAGAGARLTLLGRDRERLEARAGSLAGARVVVCDVTDEDAVRRACDEAGPVDVLVNNAGVAERGAARADVARRALAGCSTSTSSARSSAAASWCPACGSGASAGWSTSRASPACAARPTSPPTPPRKHALVGITRSLARELVRDGVTVNAVCPAYTETAILERAVRGVVEATGRDPVEARRAILAEVSQQRAVTPEEVASAVLWLSLPQQGAITGEALVISGGDLA